MKGVLYIYLQRGCDGLLQIASLWTILLFSYKFVIEVFLGDTSFGEESGGAGIAAFVSGWVVYKISEPLISSFI